MSAMGIVVGDAVALPIGGELRLVRVVTALDGSLVLADECDMRRRVVIRSRADVERYGERVSLPHREA